MHKRNQKQEEQDDDVFGKMGKAKSHVHHHHHAHAGTVYKKHDHKEGEEDKHASGV